MKQIIVLGGIGRNERENRDSMRVFSKFGLSPTLKAHIDKEQIMVAKRVKKYDQIDVIDTNDSGKIEKTNKRVVVGMLSIEGFEQDNRVYFRGGCSPTERAGNSTINVIRKYKENNRNRTDGQYSRSYI